jgi:DNA primase
VKQKITLFVDGDRGGNLIAQNVYENAKVVYITQAPDGKEVEELAGKEIHQALRKKVKAEDFLKGLQRRPTRTFSKPRFEEEQNDEPITRRALTDDDKTKLRELSSEIKGKNVLVLNEDLEVIQNVPASRLGSLRTRDAFILMTSVASSAVISGAENLKAKAVAAQSFGKVKATDVELVSI